MPGARINLGPAVTPFFVLPRISRIAFERTVKPRAAVQAALVAELALALRGVPPRSAPPPGQAAEQIAFKTKKVTLPARAARGPRAARRASVGERCPGLRSARAVGERLPNSGGEKVAVVGRRWGRRLPGAAVGSGAKDVRVSSVVSVGHVNDFEARE